MTQNSRIGITFHVNWLNEAAFFLYLKKVPIILSAPPFDFCAELRHFFESIVVLSPYKKERHILFPSCHFFGYEHIQQLQAYSRLIFKV